METCGPAVSPMPGLGVDALPVRVEQTSWLLGPQAKVCAPARASSRYTQMEANTVRNTRYVFTKKPGPVWYLRRAHACHVMQRGEA